MCKEKIDGSIDLVGRRFGYGVITKYLYTERYVKHYESKCMRCGALSRKTQTNLLTRERKGCSSCASKIYRSKEKAILRETYKRTKYSVKDIAKHFNLSRDTIDRVYFDYGVSNDKHLSFMYKSDKRKLILGYKYVKQQEVLIIPSRFLPNEDTIQNGWYFRFTEFGPTYRVISTHNLDSGMAIKEYHMVLREYQPDLDKLDNALVGYTRNVLDINGDTIGTIDYESKYKMSVRYLDERIPNAS